ncbi:hypothetical protein E0H73_12660 [Kribbella pittospori]|uniref:Uncharacterized protein n=1 Tax=Kribbella pittospori TaxID=722689 RepID=A0A4R0KR11_9ACTN|nr:hypothetical protein [Kribbella pittospori]TCC63301.1 hypothetical protein E0H73_12660 [Kribbella pittospori]
MDAKAFRSRTSRATRRTAYLLLVLLLPWATVKSIWMLGGSALGVTATEWTATTSTSDQSWLSRELARAGITPPDADPAPFTPNGLGAMILFGGTAFTALGAALATAAHSYHQRTRPTCT